MINVVRRYAAMTVAVIATMVVVGCASLKSGADPLVVRTEQTQTIAKGTFDLVVNLDNSDREFYKTNVPAFHRFAEYIRQPVTIDKTNSLPRGAAWLYSLDKTKLAYKRSLVSSNALMSVLATVETAVSQAQQQLTQAQGLK